MDDKMEFSVQIPEFGKFTTRGFMKDDEADVFVISLRQTQEGSDYPGWLGLEVHLNTAAGKASRVDYFIESEANLREAQRGLEGLIQALTHMQQILTKATITPWLPPMKETVAE